MERLTFDGSFCDIAQCSEVPGGSFCEDGACSQKKVWERLKAYEDTGLTPEEIKAPFTEDTMIKLAAQALGVEPSRLRELAEADKEGRCIILPRRVGDKIYYLKKKNIIEAEVIDYTVNEAGAWLFTVEIYDPKYDMTFQCDLETELIGKTVFFKREEAEKALQEMEGRKDG